MRAVAWALSRRLGREVTLRTVQCLQRPEKADAASEMHAAAELLLALEQSYAVIGNGGRGEEGADWVQIKEGEGAAASEGDGGIDGFIAEDTTARLRAMSVTGLQRFAGDAAPLLQLVQSREGGGSKGLMAAFGF